MVLEMINDIDNTILRLIQKYIRCDFMDHVMPYITRLGNGGIIWIIIALVFLKLTQYRLSGEVLLTTLLISALLGNLVLKPLVGRNRPCYMNKTIPLLIARPNDYSFPSGHTITSYAAANVIFYVNGYLGIAAYTLASLIALSRLYLYLHYPSDVVAGMLLGTTAGSLMNNLIR